MFLEDDRIFTDETPTAISFPDWAISVIDSILYDWGWESIRRTSGH